MFYFLDKRVWSHFDFLIILFLLPLIGLSYHLISEANTALANKQIVYFTISFFLFLFLFLLPIRNKIKIIPFFYWFFIALLICVELFGVSKLGAKRWLSLPFLNATIQPSEFIKPAFILMMGYLVHNRPPPKSGYGLKDFAYLSFFILLPFILIAKEPDLGTALILLMVGYGILFLVGVDKKIWIGIALIIGISSPVVYTYLIKDYQKKRIEDFVSKEPSYHVQQSIIAIGSGGISGKDQHEATQTQLKFLPIATSDFIFAYFVERYGFVGAAALLLIYLLIVLHLMSLNFYYKDDYLVQVFASGLGLLIFLNMAVNVLMVIGFAPVVGLPLPLFSYGGSSFMMFISMFAILENLMAFRFVSKYDFNRKL